MLNPLATVLAHVPQERCLQPSVPIKQPYLRQIFHQGQQNKPLTDWNQNVVENQFCSKLSNVLRFGLDVI